MMGEGLGDGASVWVLADDRAGTRVQAIAVAEALGGPFTIKDIAYAPTAALPNALFGASFAGVTAECRAVLAPPWPNVVIGAGRRTAPVARAIKRKSEGRAMLVQVMHPGRAGIADLDLVAVPRHDLLPPAPNILPITGAPHRVTPEALIAAASEWRPRFDDLPRPWVALIVGGSTKRRRFTAKMARDLGRRCSAMAAAAGGSLLVTTSRRTGKPADDLVAEITVPCRVFRWGDEGDNPYFGYLACADAVVVTGDSVSMCAEACAGTAPVYIYAPPGFAIDKHMRLHRELYDAGYARPLGETLETWHHPPLNAATDIAAEVRRRLGMV